MSTAPAPTEEASAAAGAEPVPEPITGPHLRLRDLPAQARAYDRRALAILVYVPIALAILEYAFVPSRAGQVWSFIEHAGGSVLTYVWYNVGTLAFMVVLPMALLRLLGVRPRDTGVRVRGTGRDAPLYGLLYLLTLPLLAWAATQKSFTSLYPFFKPAAGPFSREYLLFELTYFLQFFAVEYFFRGFITLGLKPQLGRASVLVMLAPYCMIHFHKPFPEAIGAIGAGLLLGTLSWRTNTVIWGWFLHYGIALTMNAIGWWARLGG